MIVGIVVTGCNAHTETTNNLPEGCEAQVWSFK
jgi:hypothetical protein